MVGRENTGGKVIKGLGAVFFMLMLPGVCLAAHPLITDDTGTQGKGKPQLELNYEYAHEDTDGVRESLHLAQAVLSYGIIDTVDLVVSLPYLFISTKQAGLKTNVNGISDITAEVKWRFYENECGFSLAMKPGVSIPSGDDKKGLGAGKVGASLFLVATQELDPFTFHFNAGYGRNASTADEEQETDLWHFSLATEYSVCRWLKLVANVGVERNPDKSDATPVAFVLGGVIIPLTDRMDLDVGVKRGLSEPESDFGMLAGVTLRF